MTKNKLKEMQDKIIREEKRILRRVNSERSGTKLPYFETFRDYVHSIQEAQLKAAKYE